jgi:D-sedoheptulose 7-phosphate isomerase
MVLEHPRTSSGISAAHFEDYAAKLRDLLANQDWSGAIKLADELADCWKTRRQVFLIGNGGAGASALHLANDFLYPVSKRKGSGLRVQSLLGNAAALACIANDEGYDQIFAYQLATQAAAGDVLIAISGSGNSPNIVEALKEAKTLGMRSYAIVGYSGGLAKDLADVTIHFDCHDMQLTEDAQMIVGHMILQHLYSLRDSMEPGGQ